MSELTLASASWRDYLEMTKPRVVLLMLLCALVGMFLAVPGMVPWDVLVFGLTGIALVAGSAAVVNHIADAEIDARMARTRSRPVATGRVEFASGVHRLLRGPRESRGMLILYFLVNPAHSLVEPGFLGRLRIGLHTLSEAGDTPEHRHRRALFGAAPPLFGWAAVTGTIEPGALLLVLIIFAWTPPHFWALALEQAGRL